MYGYLTRRSYPCITCHASLEEVRQRDRLTVEEEGDRRTGRIAVETLVRDRLALPWRVFPAASSVSVPERLEACGLVLVLCMDP